MQRNLLLSQKHLERDPHDPYCLYYIGVSLLLLQRAAESREYFQRALLSKDLPRFLEAMTCNLVGLCRIAGRPAGRIACVCQKIHRSGAPAKHGIHGERYSSFPQGENSAPPSLYWQGLKSFSASGRTCAKRISARNMRSSTIRNYTGCSESVFRKSTGLERLSNISSISWDRAARTLKSQGAPGSVA